MTVSGGRSVMTVRTQPGWPLFVGRAGNQRSSEPMSKREPIRHGSVMCFALGMRTLL